MTVFLFRPLDRHGWRVFTASDIRQIRKEMGIGNGAATSLQIILAAAAPSRGPAPPQSMVPNETGVPTAPRHNRALGQREYHHSTTSRHIGRLAD